MVKIIFGCLFLGLGLWGCDDEGGGRRMLPTPTPTPSPTPECIPNQELIDSECVAEDLYQACNRYFCEQIVGGPNVIPPRQAFFRECVAQDCQTIFCKLVSYNELRIRNVDGIPGIFGVFNTEVADQGPIKFGPCDSSCIIPFDDTAYLEDRFNDCPTEGLAQVCPDVSGYGCNLYREIFVGATPEIQGDFAPQGFKDLLEPCEYIDCFTMECDFLNGSVFPEVHETVIFSDITPIAGAFTASSIVEGKGEFNFVECSFFSP